MPAKNERMRDGGAQAGPRETSPLLGGSTVAVRDSADAETPASNGTFGQPNGAATDSAEEASDSETREGLPEVAAKLPILVPAIGIGVS